MISAINQFFIRYFVSSCSPRPSQEDLKETSPLTQEPNSRKEMEPIPEEEEEKEPLKKEEEKEPLKKAPSWEDLFLSFF
jgi:hypothetical protein